MPASRRRVSRHAGSRRFHLDLILTSRAIVIHRFSQFPGSPEPGDPRSAYSAFAVASILDDWSTIDVDRTLDYLATCQVCEMSLFAISNQTSVSPPFRYDSDRKEALLSVLLPNLKVSQHRLLPAISTETLSVLFYRRWFHLLRHRLLSSSTATLRLTQLRLTLALASGPTNETTTNPSRQR